MISKSCYVLSSVSLSIFCLFFSHASTAWSQTTGTSSSSNQIEVSELTKCHINTDAQPESTLAMNVESINSFVSTVSAAREALACQTSDGELVLVDVTIFAKLTDRIDTNSKAGRTVQALVCAKDVNGTVIQCVSNSPEQKLTPMKCYIKKPYPRGPLQMDTVVGSGIMRTAEVDSDVYNCVSNNNQQIRTLTFTFVTLSQDIASAKTESAETLICQIFTATPGDVACLFRQAL